MANHLDSFFAAVADPTRRAVIERLTAGPATVKELHDGHALSLPGFLKHLKVLEEAGLIVTEKDGRTRHVRIRLDPLEEAEDWLNARRKQWEGRLMDLTSLIQAAAQDEGEQPL